MPEVVIIGGGVAGLAAAVELTSVGISTILIEQKSYLGGRVHSFIHPETGDEVDNGQHIMMGCYHSTIKFLTTINALSKISIQPKLEICFQHAEKEKSYLSANKLPAPFHILVGLLKLKSIPFFERLLLLRVGVELLLVNSENKKLRSLTVAQWLDELYQSEKAKKYLWDIIAIGALNNSTEKITASLFVKVLQEAFLGSNKNSSIILPLQGLSSVFVENAITFIEKNGGKILLNTSVSNIHIENVRVKSVTLNSGETIIPKAVISTVPYFDFPKMFSSETLEKYPSLQYSQHHTSSPIITIHLWFDTHFFDEEFVALLDSPLHWIFNKTKIYTTKHHSLMYLAIVISGAEEFVSSSKEELLEMTISELRKFYPHSSNAKLIHFLIIKEKRATFSPFVGVEKVRPSHTTEISNFFIGGDWSNTGLPATIEGAIQSGSACAELVKRNW